MASPEAPSPEVLGSASLLVLGEAPGEKLIEAARTFAEAGHTVLVPLETAESAAPLARLLNLPELPASEAPVKEFSLLSQVDFRHPLLTPFADPRFSDFSKIHFWHYRRVNFSALPQAAVLARFEAGDPALVQVPLGKGSAVVLTSSWRPADSQLALSSKFVPLLQSLLEHSGGPASARAQYLVGEELPVPSAPGTYQIQKPDGTLAPVEAGGRFYETQQPGFYMLKPGALLFPVNLDPAESRLAPLKDAQLTALGLPLAGLVPASEEEAARQRHEQQAAAEESQQKLWRWLLLGAVLLLFVETALAARREKAHSPAPG